MKNIILLLKVIFVFAFFISVPQTIYGQNKDLVLTHKVSGTEYIIYRKYKIEVTNNEGLKQKDNFYIISDSTIVLGRDTILLSSISKIRFKNSFTRSVGVVFIGGGVLSAFFGSFLLNNTAYEPVLFLFLELPSLLAGGVGVILGIKYLGGKNYKAEDWEISVR